MTRLGMCVGAAAWLGLCSGSPCSPANAGVPYITNGPSVAVPITDNTAQPIAPWVQGDPDLPGNIVYDEVHDYAWTFFPASAGRVQLRAVRSAKTGRIALWVGVKPSAGTANMPTEVAIYGLKTLDLEIGRKYAGEKVAPVTHVRSEQNQVTKLYHLVFTLNTPLPRNRMTWLVIKTKGTKTETGGMMTFADNDTQTGPWPKYPFVRVTD